MRASPARRSPGGTGSAPLAVALAALVLAQGEIRAPRLSEFTPASPAGTPVAVEEGREVPALATVCRDAGSGRCWALPGSQPCAGAEVFLVVPAAATDETRRRCETSP